MSFRFEVKPSNPGLGTTATVSWEHTSGWSRKYKFGVRFTLIKPNGEQVQVFPSSGRCEYVLYPRKTKTGSFNFTVPDLPGKYTLIGVVDLYYAGKWVQDEKVSYSWTIPGTEEPGVGDFVNALVQHYRGKTPTISVESKLKSKINRDKPTYEYLDDITVCGIPLTYADDNYDSGGTLGLYLDKPDQISVQEYGWDEPPARYDDGRELCMKVVRGWLEGYELIKMYSPKSGKWYWVKVPAEFSYKAPRATPVLSVKSDGTVEFGVEGYCRVVAYDYDVGGYVTDYERPWGAKLFVDGKLIGQVQTDREAWKAGQRRFTKTAKLPSLSIGYHTLTLILLRYSDRGFYAMSKQIYVTIPPKAEIRHVVVNGESVGNGGSKTISTPDVTVKVGVSNTGGKGDIVAHITIKDSGGKEVYSTTQTVGLSTGETKEVTFETTLPKVDAYKVTVSVGH